MDSQNDEKQDNALLVAHTSPPTAQGGFYAILGIQKNADLNEIKKRYRKLSLLHHPDKIKQKFNREATEQEEEYYKAIVAAYECLSDPEKRAQYDNPIQFVDASFFANLHQFRMPGEDRVDIRHYLKNNFNGGTESWWGAWSSSANMQMFFLNHAPAGITIEIQRKLQEAGFVDVDVHEEHDDAKKTSTYTLQGFDLKMLLAKAHEQNQPKAPAQTAEQNFMESESWRNDIPSVFDIDNIGEHYLNQSSQLLKKAAKEKHIEAMYLYARLEIVNHPHRLYRENKRKLILGSLKNAAIAGHTMAKFDLARYYAEGRENYLIEKNVEIAQQIAATINYDELSEKNRKILEDLGLGIVHSLDNMPLLPRDELPRNNDDDDDDDEKLKVAEPEQPSAEAIIEEISLVDSSLQPHEKESKDAIENITEEHSQQQSLLDLEALKNYINDKRWTNKGFIYRNIAQKIFCFFSTGNTPTGIRAFRAILQNPDLDNETKLSELQRIAQYRLAHPPQLTKRDDDTQTLYTAIANNDFSFLNRPLNQISPHH